MNTDSPFPDPDELPSDDRERMLELLEDGIREAHRKVETGRIRDEEKEKLRIKWIRALAYSVAQYRKLRKDADLDELEERIERIEGR
jgi:hypothetical protein